MTRATRFIALAGVLAGLSAVEVVLHTGLVSWLDEYFQRRMSAVDQGIILRHDSMPGSLERYGCREVTVAQEDGEFCLFYGAVGGNTTTICSACSRDLKTWTRRGVQLSASSDRRAPDSAAVLSGWPLWDGSLWHMYYLGTRQTGEHGIPFGTGCTLEATAPHLSGPWTKTCKLVLSPTFDPYSWRSQTTSPGPVICWGKEYLMFFSGSSLGRDYLRAIGIARAGNPSGPWKAGRDPILPWSEQIETASMYFEQANQTWFLFTNHVKGEPPHTASIRVYWTHDPNRWNQADSATVLDGRNCTWSHACIGMPSVIKIGNRLAIFYDAPGGDSTSHYGRDIGLAWLKLPLAIP